MPKPWNQSGAIPTNNPIPLILRWLRRITLPVLLIWFLLSSFVTIPADSVGILQRFGKFTSTLEPGLRFRFPFGIDTVEKIPIQRQLKLEFGFSTPGSTNPDQIPDAPTEEQSIVTGDLSMATVEWIVQYRIDDPTSYLFHVRDPGWTLRDASESVMREVIGDRTVDEVITVGRQEIEHEALTKLQDVAKKYSLGASVLQVQLKNVHPPQPVQLSFNEVNQAKQEKEQSINLANGEYNRAVPRARGEAMRKISEAQGYATKRTNEALGDAARFSALLAEYSKAPEVTRQRLYLETMKEVLPSIERKIVTDQKLSPALPVLPLDPTSLRK